MAKNRGVQQWRVSTRRDLAGFDDNATNAVLFAMARGGVGKISTTGHVMLRNRKGDVMGVSRDLSKSKQVVAIQLRNLFGESVVEAKSPAPEATTTVLVAPVERQTLACYDPGCSETFTTEGARYSHAYSAHHVCPEPGCTFTRDKEQAVTGHYMIVHQGHKPAKGRGRNQRGRKVMAETTTAITPQAVVSTVRDVTPALAQMWMAANTRNRHLRPDLVAMYARDMESGRWLLTGESIKFGHGGVLLDGQHRLAAVVKADTTVRMLVVTGLENESQKVMDTGAKRLTADMLHLDGVPNATVVSSAVRLLLGISWGMPSRQHVSTYRMSNQEVYAFIDEYRADVQAAATLAVHFKDYIDLRPSVVTSGAFWMARKASPEIVNEFFEGLAYGQTSGPQDARTQLQRLIAMQRKWRALTGASRGRVGQVWELTALLHTWNLWRRNTEVKSLRPPSKLPKPV